VNRETIIAAYSAAHSDIERARASAALWWWDRDGAVSCGKRDAETIMGGRADHSSDVQAALSAIRFAANDSGFRHIKRNSQENSK
jgi:hypothetical protein